MINTPWINIFITYILKKLKFKMYLYMKKITLNKIYYHLKSSFDFSILENVFIHNEKPKFESWSKNIRYMSWCNFYNETCAK